YQSGLLPIPLTFAEDDKVLDYDIGLTNLVDRTSPGQDDLTKDELRAGAEVLKDKLRHHQPRIVCFNGMGIYQAFIGSTNRLPLGLQPEPWEGMLMYVVPSSSGRTAAYQRDAKLAYYKDLKALVDKVGALEATA